MIPAALSSLAGTRDSLIPKGASESDETELAS